MIEKIDEINELLNSVDIDENVNAIGLLLISIAESLAKLVEIQTPAARLHDIKIDMLNTKRIVDELAKDGER